ncbi:MAG: GGDEF domain-containing protein [Pseudomonadota bacterium]
METEGDSRHWDYANATLDMLRTHGLRPCPEFYHVWFVYHADENPEVLRAIDAARASGEPISEETLLRLYYRYIFDRQAASFLRRGMDDFNDVICNSEETIASAHSELGAYGEVLEAAQKTLRNDKKTGEIIDRIVVHTRKVQGTVATLGEQLAHYQQKITHLQQELQQTRERSYTDGLTGVSNRLHLEEILAEQCLTYDEDGDSTEPFCVMMVDLDQFKQINDRHGHRIGDEVLVLIAGMLKAHTKGRDIVARYGGDEFVVLLPDTLLADAELLASDICSRIRARDIRAKASGTSYGNMTISIGIAQYVRGEGPFSLIDRADGALYRAKDAGRDRYCAAISG